MARQNDFYNAVWRVYDQRQLENRRAFDQKLFQVYEKVPALRELDDKKVHSLVSSIKEEIVGEKTSTDFGKSSLTGEAYQQERERLLVSAGFPKDYLSIPYTCPICKDTGFVENRRCKCFQAAYINLLYQDSPLRRALEKENFDTFSYQYYSDDVVDRVSKLTPLQNMKKIIPRVKSFIQSFGNPNSECRNLLIRGNTGVGKTFLTNCIARELINLGFGVVYLSANDLVSTLEDFKFRRNTTDGAAVIERYTAVMESDLLIIDDLGTEQISGFTTTLLFHLFNHRLLKQHATIITTNLSFPDMQANYSERITSRIMSSYENIRLFGEDLRLK